MGTVRSLRGPDRALRVGATPVPHAEILDVARRSLIDVGIDLRIEVFDTFDLPNVALVDGAIDANFFQYLPFLDEFNRSNGADLRPVTAVHIEPFALYSEKVAAVEEVPSYAEVAIPGDPVNADRALRVLRDLELIDLRAGTGRLTTEDIVANPRQLLLKGIESALLTDVLSDFDMVFLFGNYALDRGIDLGAALYCDHANPAFAEYLVARADNHRSGPIRELARVLQSEDMRRFLARSYRGRVAPAF